MDTSLPKTKILFVITKSNFGGAQKYVYDLARSLPRDRFDVAVVTGGKGTLIQKLSEQNIRTILVPSLTRDVDTGNDFSALLELFNIFREERADVVHLNSAKAGGVGALAARLVGVSNIIFTAHGWAFNEERPQWQRMLIKFFSWMTVLLTHRTIAVSNAVLNDTKNWPLVRNKIITIHNGIDAPAFLSRDEARKKITDERSISPDAFILGTIAELHPNKGLSFAIEAMAKIAPLYKNIFYFIIGDGEERRKLEALIKEHGLRDRVILLGFIPDAMRLLPAFDMFLFPSVKEGLPYAILEAGLAKLPIITTNVGGIPEIIEDGVNGMITAPHSADAIAEKIQLLLDSKENTQKLGKALHESISVKFSLEHMVSETIALYTKKLG